ncbi:MAG: hypothetical protein ACRDG4_03270, partial [Chloroflexota bacterium]
AHFLRELADLTEAEKAAFTRARERFVADLQAGRPPRAGLRVREMTTESGVYELTWAPDGRAGFEYGPARATSFGVGSVVMRYSTIRDGDVDRVQGGISWLNKDITTNPRYTAIASCSFPRMTSGAFPRWVGGPSA